MSCSNETATEMAKQDVTQSLGHFSLPGHFQSAQSQLLCNLPRFAKLEYLIESHCCAHRRLHL